MHPMRALSLCLKSKPSTIATIRLSACRRSAAAPTRWRAIEPSCAPPCSSMNCKTRECRMSPRFGVMRSVRRACSTALPSSSVIRPRQTSRRALRQLRLYSVRMQMVIVVDDDIDVSNFEQLMWAMVTRCDPATSIDILRRMRTSPADPRLTPEQRKARILPIRGWWSMRRDPTIGRTSFASMRPARRALAKDRRNSIIWK